MNKILTIQNNFSLDKLKVIENIKTPHTKSITSICLLKDKRLVSAGGDGLIIVYDNSHKPQIEFKNARNEGISSLCVLRNGDLVASSKVIKIWRIGENNYQLIHTLKRHTDWVTKVIELEAGRIASCSRDKAIIIWDNSTYQSITNISTGHTDEIRSIIEMNDSIISVSIDKTLRRWNKSSYECIQIIENVSCCCQNALEKLNNHTLLLGGNGVLSVVDIESSGLKKLKVHTLGFVSCFRVIRNDLLLFGNHKGEIFCYNPISNQIISKSKFHNRQIACLIETEQNQLISSSYDKTIKIYMNIYDNYVR